MSFETEKQKLRKTCTNTDINENDTALLNRLDLQSRPDNNVKNVCVIHLIKGYEVKSEIATEPFDSRVSIIPEDESGGGLEE